MGRTPGGGNLRCAAIAGSSSPAGSCVGRRAMADAPAPSSGGAAPPRGLLTALVGPDAEEVAVPVENVPVDSFLGALVRQHGSMEGDDAVVKLPQNDPSFVRLLCRWSQESSRSKAASFTRYRCSFSSFARSFPDVPSATLSGLDEEHVIQHSRISLILRGGYMDVAPPEEPGGDWLAHTPEPSVVNELRVRCVNCQLPSWNGTVTTKSRILPAFTLSGGNEGSDEWVPICSSDGVHSDALEVRSFALSNVPLRRRCSAELEAAFFALDEQLLWTELDVHVCDDLTLCLARSIVASKSKLKNFLTRAAPPKDGEPQPKQVDPPRLKQWPGKDAVQALAVWWMAATLCDDHRYTEPELYAVISSHCAMQPDHGVMRKEMVRRGYLEQPEIVDNADKTTTTYYRQSLEGVRAALRGEWRKKGVF